MTAELHNPPKAAMASHVDVDAVVREVLRRLSSDRPLADKVAAPSGTATTEDPTNPGNVTLSQRVVTLDDIEHDLETLTTLTVPRGAVVTPAVRDVLKKHRITLRHADEDRSPANQSAITLTVATTVGTHQTQNLIQALDGTGAVLEEIKTNDLAEAVSQLVTAVTRTRQIAMLLTDRSALAACMANRDAQVRAAVVHSLADVRAATESLGANVLVVDPQATGMHALRSMASAFVRRPAENCPAELSNFGSSTKGCGCSSAK